MQGAASAPMDGTNYKSVKYPQKVKVFYKLRLYVTRYCAIADIRLVHRGRAKADTPKLAPQKRSILPKSLYITLYI
jgi:hypothetical protein